MVNLDIYSFCEDCPRFEAKSTTNTASCDNKTLWVTTNVTCAHSEFCGNIYNYLKKIFENKFYGSCKCQPPEGVVIKPDGVNELDPCVYEEVETHHNVDLTILKCKKCGHMDFEWRYRDDE